MGWKTQIVGFYFETPEIWLKENQMCSDNFNLLHLHTLDDVGHFEAKFEFYMGGLDMPKGYLMV